MEEGVTSDLRSSIKTGKAWAARRNGLTEECFRQCPWLPGVEGKSLLLLRFKTSPYEWRKISWL